MLRCWSKACVREGTKEQTQKFDKSYEGRGTKARARAQNLSSYTHVQFPSEFSIAFALDEDSLVNGEPNQIKGSIDRHRLSACLPA
jgi:hypothetical protein